MDAGYNYDHLNADSLLRSTVGGKMLVTPGGAVYQALVLPELDMIDAALAEKIASWASVGLPILFAEHMPVRADGLEENAQRGQTTMAAMRGSMRRMPSTTLSVEAFPDLMTLMRTPRWPS